MEPELVDDSFFLVEVTFEGFILSLIFPREFYIPLSNIGFLIEGDETLEFKIS